MANTVRYKETTYTIWASVQVIDEDGKLRWEKEIENIDGSGYEFMDSLDDVQDYIERFWGKRFRHETLQKARFEGKPLKVPGKGTLWLTGKTQWVTKLV